MIPAVLLQIADYLTKALKNKELILSAGSGDGRTDSTLSEEKIVSILQKAQKAEKWNIRPANIGRKHNRSWYDLLVNKTLHCDIKVSTLKGNDNTNAKRAIYFFLTGQDPEKVTTVQAAFFKKMKENENSDESRDFYYLVVDKATKHRVFVVSLKHIKKVEPAHNNPPFQCKWIDCIEPEPRTWEQAKSFLLMHWAEAMTKGINHSMKNMLILYKEYPPHEL